MHILDDFIAIGTQIKTERPGKGTVGTPCDSIEGPMVLLRNGDFVQVNALEEADTVKSEVKEVIDLGEILIPFGEFVENNAILPQASYSYEWWVQELEEKIGCKSDDEAADAVSKELGHDVDIKEPSPEDAFLISEKFDIPLHPSYNLFWHDVSTDEIKMLAEAVGKAGYNGSLMLPKSREIKEVLLNLGALHKEREKLIVEKYAYSLIRCCGFDVEDGKIVRKRNSSSSDPLEMVSGLSGVKIMPRAPQRIGTRMGRPEKAAERTMRATPHVLFPVGEAGGGNDLSTLLQGRIK